MAKKQSSLYMTGGEVVGGVIFIVIYLLVLPFVTAPAFRLAERLLDMKIPQHVENLIYYYALFAVTVIMFHNFLGRTTRNFFDRLGFCAKTMVLGMVAFYGLNELVFRLVNLVITSRTNLNDSTISAQIDDAPRSTRLIIIFLAPFVEEVLFRGLVFGNLKNKSRLMAYFVSCALFAALHVWQFAVVHQDVTYLLICVQYFVPGMVLAWAYEHTGTLWTAIGIHAAVNALSALAMI